MPGSMRKMKNIFEFINDCNERLELLQVLHCGISAR